MKVDSSLSFVGMACTGKKGGDALFPQPVETPLLLLQRGEDRIADFAA
jgi:hypothetical protein